MAGFQLGLKFLGIRHYRAEFVHPEPSIVRPTAFLGEQHGAGSCQLDYHCDYQQQGFQDDQSYGCSYDVDTPVHKQAIVARTTSGFTTGASSSGSDFGRASEGSNTSERYFAPMAAYIA